MRRATLKQPGGFTLIEVLVALAVVAIALAAGVRASGNLITNAERLASVSDAQWCADNHLTNLKLARLFPSVGASDQTCLQRGRSYQVHTTVQPTLNPNFRVVEAAVSDEAGVPQARVLAVLARY